MPESWWKDLPPNCLAVMGYSGEEEQPTSDVPELTQEIKNLRRSTRGLNAEPQTTQASS